MASKNNELDFFKAEFIIKIVFDGKDNTFKEFEDVFKFLNDYDRLYYQYSTETPNNRNQRYYKRTKVLAISKNSPLEISVFIEKNWFEILLFLLSTNRETIILNVRQNYQDFVNIINSIDEKFLEVTENFPNFDIEEITRFVHWFENLNIDEKYRIFLLIKRSLKILNKIIRIIKINQ